VADGLQYVWYTSVLSYRLFNGGSRIRPVAENQVHIVEVQALERRLGPLYNVLPRQATVVGPVFVTEEYFRRHNLAFSIQFCLNRLE
jgi:hypothetical protein